MYAIVAIVACCAIVTVTMVAVVLVNSLGKRVRLTRQDHPTDGGEVAVPPHQEAMDRR
jgi:hypothetical protein